MDAKLIQQIRDQMDERKRVSEMNTYERRGRAKGLAEGLEKGREEGLEEGLEKGKVQERMANARKMKELGIDIALICQVTGLSEQQVLDL